MNEIYEMLRQKLSDMRYEQSESVTFDFKEVSQMYQLVCLMKQIREIVNWAENGFF
jgi:hypothetical protein